MGIACSHCDAEIAEEKIDRSREIATCGSCDRLVDVRDQLARAKAAADGAAADNDRGTKMRDPIALPPGMRMTRVPADDSLAITRRWLRGKHYLWLLALAVATVVVVHFWSSNEGGPWLIIGTIFLAVWYGRVLSMFVNSTEVHITPDQVRVTHGPLPTVLFRPVEVAASEIEQLFARQWARFYEVRAQLKSGEQVTLVRPLITQEQALFVEQQIESKLGIVDFEVEGELPRLPQPVAAPGGNFSVGFLVIPAVAGGVAMMLMIASAEVSGTLTGKGERLGELKFTPDDCSSGQLRGYFGVQLTSEASPGTAVRLIRDPASGPMVAIERGKGAPITLRPEECRRLNLSIEQTDTNYNDVWLIDGSADIDCDELRGLVQFEGCSH